LRLSSRPSRCSPPWDSGGNSFLACYVLTPNLQHRIRPGHLFHIRLYIVMYVPYGNNYLNKRLVTILS
jgi:hypothetical protein